MQAGMMLEKESSVLHLSGSSKWTVCHTQGSDTLPTEGMARIKGVPSCLKVWIKGLCEPASSNKITLLPTRAYLLIVPLLEFIGAKYIQTVT